MSSLNSITNGGEKYLHKLIAPLIKRCKYSLLSTKDFQKNFSKIQNFNESKYEICTFDCVSLYTSVDLKQTINYILTTIYDEKDLFFPDETKTIKIRQEIKTEKVKPPNKNQVKRLFDAVCTQYNSLKPKVLSAN